MQTLYSFQQQPSMPMLTTSQKESFVGTWNGETEIPTTPEIQTYLIGSSSPNLLCMIEGFCGLTAGVSPSLAFPSSPSIGSESKQLKLSPEAFRMVTLLLTIF